jgi:hypothetical protein
LQTARGRSLNFRLAVARFKTESGATLTSATSLSVPENIHLYGIRRRPPGCCYRLLFNPKSFPGAASERSTPHPDRFKRIDPRTPRDPSFRLCRKSPGYLGLIEDQRIVNGWRDDWERRSVVKRSPARPSGPDRKRQERCLVKLDGLSCPGCSCAVSTRSGGEAHVHRYATHTLEKMVGD